MRPGDDDFDSGRDDDVQPPQTDADTPVSEGDDEAQATRLGLGRREPGRRVTGRWEIVDGEQRWVRENGSYLVPRFTGDPAGTRAPSAVENRRRERRLSSISLKVRELLLRDADMLDAVRVIERAEGADGIEENYTARMLTNADLVAMSVLGIALNRTGRVSTKDQLAAIQLIWAYMDGTPASRQDMLAEQEREDGSGTKPVISVDDFRRAMGMMGQQQEPQEGGGGSDDDGVIRPDVENDVRLEFEVEEAETYADPGE